MADTHSPETARRREAASSTLRPPFVAPTEGALVCAMLPDAPDRERAWAEFYKRHGPSLLGFIQVQMGPDRRDDCEDVFGDLIARIETHLVTYDHRREGGFHSWCVKIAHNLCRSAHRLKAGEPAPAELVSFEDVDQWLLCDGIKVDEIPMALTPEAENDNVSEQKQILKEAFKSLGSVDQAVIHFRYIAPIPDKQVAATINKPETQIRMIREKAVKKLRRACERIAQTRRR